LVTVLIPGKNEGPNVEPLIDSLNNQSYSNLEIIFIDDGSDDRTPEIGNRLESEGRIDRFLRKGTRGGKSSAANFGLEFANGKFVVHVDADSVLHERAVESILIPFYQHENIGAVGGDLRVFNRWSSLATSLQAYEYLTSITYGRTAVSQLGLLQIISGAFGAFRTETLHRIGGWDVGPGEDRDIVLKIRKLGFDIFHMPGAICYTRVPETFTDLARQRTRWNRSTVRFLLRKHYSFFNINRPFRFKDFLSVSLPIFFSIFLLVMWPVYWIQMSIFYVYVIPFVIILNIIVYSISSMINLSILSFTYRSILYGNEIGLIIFSPLMTLYTGVYLRAVRGYAYLTEGLFRASYWNSFIPWKVGSEAREADAELLE
jgi:biofilm PGA synthesis N-glycosyltransferase PgaC